MNRDSLWLNNHKNFNLRGKKRFRQLHCMDTIHIYAKLQGKNLFTTKESFVNNDWLKNLSRRVKNFIIISSSTLFYLEGNNIAWSWT